MQELKSHLLRTQRLKVLPLKPGVGQYISIAIRTTLTARIFFLANFYPSGTKTSPEFFLCWLWLKPVPVWARRIKSVVVVFLDLRSKIENMI